MKIKCIIQILENNTIITHGIMHSGIFKKYHKSLQIRDYTKATENKINTKNNNAYLYYKVIGNKIKVKISELFFFEGG